MLRRWPQACALGNALATVTFRMVEFLTTLGLFVGAVFIGSWLIWGDEGKPHYLRAVGLLKLMNDNWKALLLIAVLLFYRPVRTFVEEVQDAGMLSRRGRQRARQAPTQDPNPPTRQTT